MKGERREEERKKIHENKKERVEHGRKGMENKERNWETFNNGRSEAYGEGGVGGKGNRERRGKKREKGGIRQLGKGTRRRKAQKDTFMTGNTQDILCEREPVNSLL